MTRLAALSVFIFTLLGQPAHAWEVIMTQKGVEVAQKTMENSQLMAFRGEGVMDVPVGKLVAVLLADHLATEWVDLQAEHTVVREDSAAKSILYQRYDLPFPIDDRDYVLEEVTSFDDANWVFTLKYESIEHPDRPVSSCCVRARAYRTFWRLTKLDAGRTKVEVEVFTDPKGMLPSWLINMIQKDWPWKSITGLVNRATQGDIEPEPRSTGWTQ